jgi:hypothetical protein
MPPTFTVKNIEHEVQSTDINEKSVEEEAA